MDSLVAGFEKGMPSVMKTLEGVTDTIQTGIGTSVSVAQAPYGNSQIVGMLEGIRDNMSMSVYLDGKTLVGGIAPTMNTALGRL